MNVKAPRFEIDECRGEAEREFVETLHSRAEARGWYADAWPRDDRLILTVDLCDPEYNCVLRMLRVDFDGSVMYSGPDETSQLVSDLNPDRADVLRMCDQSPTLLANAAADWLEREMGRPIERLEWTRSAFRHRLWRFADTGEELLWSDSENKRRTDLGSPDRVASVR